MEQAFGLVLCGGGAKGAYQMGALQALKQAGELEQLCGISGVSIGALNGLFLECCGVDTGIEVWKQIQPSTVFTLDLSLLDGKEGLFSRQGMVDLLNQFFDYDTFCQNQTPFYVATASMEYTEPVVHYHKLNGKSREDIITLMEATSALPLIYEDVAYQGELHRDGGLKDNMPIKPLYDQGCRRFLVLSMSSDAVIDTAKYPDAEFYLLKPYKDLGGLLSGTLNFTKAEISMNLKLGYKDGERFVKAFLKQDALTAKYYDMYAQMDYDSVMVDVKQEALQAGIDEKFDYIAQLEKKYDI